MQRSSAGSSPFRGPDTRQIRAGLPTRPAITPEAYPRAATTLENTFWIWFPMVKRITITTIETRTRIKAYSTIPWPLWRRTDRRFMALPPFSQSERFETLSQYNAREAIYFQYFYFNEL